MDCHGVYKLTCVHTIHMHPSTAYTRASCSSHARPRKPSKHSHSPSPLSRPRSEHSASSEIVPMSGEVPVAVIASTTLTINPPATASVLTTPADIGNAPPTIPVEVPLCAVATTSRRNCTPVWPGLSLNVTRKSIRSAVATFTSVVLKLAHELAVPWPPADGMCWAPSDGRLHALKPEPVVTGSTSTPSSTSFGSAWSALFTRAATTVSSFEAAMPSVRQTPPYGSW